MPTNNRPTPSEFREAVCVNVDRIYDCCRDRDCMQDLRVYLTAEGQEVLEDAVSVKPGEAKILWSYIDVEPLAFNNGFYTVDIQFFIRVSFDVFRRAGRPQRIEGCCTFNKKAILYGSEGGARIYSSEYAPQGPDRNLEVRSNRPRATVEVLDPITLDCRYCDPNDPCSGGCGCDNTDVASMPGYISSYFESPLTDPDNARRLYVTMGLFSIVRLMREVQLLIPACDFCIPEKESCWPSEEDPCGLFGKMDFPLDQFFPPLKNPAAVPCSCSGNSPAPTQRNN